MYLQLTCPRVDPTCGLNGQLISDSSTPSLKTQLDRFSQKYLFSPQSKALNVWLHVAHINWTKQRPCEHFAFWSQGQNAPYVTAYVVFTWYQEHLSQCPANAWFRVCPRCAPITTDHVVWWYNRKRSQLIAEAFRLFICISISFVTHAYYWTSIIRPWSLDITPQRFNECRVLFLSYVRMRILLKHVFTRVSLN